MFYIDRRGSMKLTKNDSCSFNVDIFDLDGKSVKLNSGEYLRLTVRKTPTTTPFLARDYSSANLWISNTDTASVATGLYLYDIELYSSGSNYTIAKGFIDILPQISED